MTKSCSITPIGWWNPDTNTWESSVPHVLLDPSGNPRSIGTRVRLINTGTEAFHMECRFRHYTPGGTYMVNEQGAGHISWPVGNVWDCDCVYPGGWYEGTWFQAAELKDMSTGAVIGSASFSEAIMTRQLPYAGRIERVDWRPVGGSWAAIDAQNPPSLAQGTEMELAVVFRNTGAESLYWQLEFIVTLPGGGSRSFTYVVPELPPSPPGGPPTMYPLSPDTGLQLTFNERLLLDEVGAYLANIILRNEGTGQTLDSKTLTIATVSAPAPSIQGSIVGLTYWHQGLPGWLELNPESLLQLARDTDLYLAVWWINTGDTDIRGHVGLEVTLPDQSKMVIEATQNQDLLASPDNGYGVVFDKISLSQVGSYQGQVTLSSL